jgi:hypothetical protein
MIELFVENYKADINEDISALLTFTIDDLKDFSGRNCTFSKTIVLPGTHRNNVLFGNIFDFNVSNNTSDAAPNIMYNYNATKSAAAIMFQDNIQIFKGTVRIMEIIIDKGVPEYEVVVFGELGGLVGALGAKKLDELDFSFYDGDYTLAKIVNSWDNASAGEGLFFPHIDYGTFSSNKHDWIYRTFRPALFVKEYIEKIFAGVKYTFNAPLFDTTRFKSLIVPHARKRLTRRSETSLFVAPLFTTYGLPQSTIAVALNPSTTGIVLGDFILSSGNTWFQYNGSDTLVADVYLAMSGTFTKTRTNSPFSVRVVKVTQIGNQDFGMGVTSGAYDANIVIPNVTFNTGEYLQITCFSATNPHTDSLNFTVSAGSLVLHTKSAQDVLVNLGENIVVNDCIPQNILQVEFLSSIIKLFNLYVYEDRFERRQLKISPYVDFYDTDPSTALDWSGKVDRNSIISIKPMSELNARYYEFLFAEDSDYWNELYNKRYNQSYGSYIMDSRFEFAKEKESIELIFSGTPIVGYVGQDKVYSTIFKKSGDTEENVDSNIRIMLAKKITGVSSWAIKSADGATTLGSYTKYGYAGHYDDPDAPSNDLNFGAPKELFFALAAGAINVNQFNVYWSSYMAEIIDKDSKLLTATFRLTTRDIFKLDFSKFIYLDGSLWRLNKIEDYNASNEDTCKVTLLKTINTTY